MLVRAIQPMVGLKQMFERRKMPKGKFALTSGPGKLSQALGLSKKQSGLALNPQSGIWIRDIGITPMAKDIQAATRIGIDYAEEDALLPYRYYLKGNPWVSVK